MKQNFQPQSTQRAAELQIDINDFEVKGIATGWLKENNVLERVVDIIMNDDGSLFGFVRLLRLMCRSF